MRLLGSVFAATVIISAATSAHHSPAAFDLNSQVTIQGAVSRFDWTNPHAYIYVTASAGAGETVEWMIETDGTSILTRSGWSRDSVAVGSIVTVRANPDRDAQRNHALLVSMALGDGVVLTPRSGGASTVSRAANLSGVWNALRGFTQRRFGAFVPTAKGTAAIEAYTEAANPTAECVPWPAPFLPSLPYLNEIEILDDSRLGRRMAFDPEILVRAIWAGIPLRFVSVHVQYPVDGRSHFHYFWDNLEIAWMHTRLIFGMLIRLPRLIRRNFAQRSGHAAS